MIVYDEIPTLGRPFYGRPQVGGYDAARTDRLLADIGGRTGAQIGDCFSVRRPLMRQTVWARLSTLGCGHYFK